MGSRAAQVSRRDPSAVRRVSRTPFPDTQSLSSAPSCGEGRTRMVAPAALSAGSGRWTLTPRVRLPEVKLGRPRLPQPAAPAGHNPERCHGTSAPGPGQSGQESQPRAPGRGQAAPSPAPARRSHGRSSKQQPTGHSTGCSARSWWGRVAGTGTVQGAAAGGAGALDRPGWAPAERASRRRDYLIVLSGEEQGGGAGRPHPPAGQGRGGGHCSSLRPPLAPHPAATLRPSPRVRAAGSRGMRSRGPAKGAITRDSGMG